MTIQKFLTILFCFVTICVYCHINPADKCSFSTVCGLNGADSNSDGQLNADEYAGNIECRELNGMATVAWKEADSNGDGWVDGDEFDSAYPS